jgi:CheY-like chemotaxis protein
MSSSKLSGVSILVVEDDPIIALDLGEMLTQQGALLVGPAHTVPKALELIANHMIDVAVLDYRLENDTAVTVAAPLEARHIPFLFHTSSRGDPQRAYPHVRILHKPTQPEQLVSAITALITQR